MTNKLDVDKVIEEADASIEEAHKMVSDLCKGDRKWLMSIPARPDYDPDLVITKGLRAGDNLLTIAKQLREENLELKHKIENLLRDIVGGIHD